MKHEPFAEPPKPKSYEELAALAPSVPRQLPPGFPAEIPVEQIDYRNWSLAIDVPDVWLATARTADDLPVLANWARLNGFRLRGSGCRHNWSPLVIPNDADTGSVLLVDLRQLSGLIAVDTAARTATFGIGTTVEEATAAMQDLDNGGASQAPGFTWQNFTAPGALTLGGVLAIGAHGTSLPFDGHPQPLAGTMSNLVTSFKAVVTDPAGNPDEYTIREFHRGEADADVFLVHLGRAMLVEVTLKMVPNYYLEVRNWYPRDEVLFEAPTGTPAAESISEILDRYGRVEVIWFPFTNEPWVKTWEQLPQLTQEPVDGPYNYPWANNITLEMNEAIRQLLFNAPPLTPWFGASQLLITQLAAPTTDVMQGTARDLLLYVEDSTLRVTAIGYAVQLRRDEVQQAAHEFFLFYRDLLERYRNEGLLGKYPVNGPVELRWTSLDTTADLGVPGANPPAISPGRSIRPQDPALDTLFWVDALTIPGTAHSSEFFAEVESWMTQTWGSQTNNVMRPEWSKGWAYTPGVGAWTNQQILTQAIPAHYDQPAGTDAWTYARTVLDRYDRHRIYTNGFLDILLPSP